MVEVNNKLVRSCGTMVEEGVPVITESAYARAAQREAFDWILGNNLFYCVLYKPKS
jgi:formate dehydrogenase major subunit